MVVLMVKNTDESTPVIVRAMRVNEAKEEIDCLYESQLLPRQSADFEVGEGQSLVILQR